MKGLIAYIIALSPALCLADGYFCYFDDENNPYPVVEESYDLTVCYQVGNEEYAVERVGFWRGGKLINCTYGDRVLKTVIQEDGRFKLVFDDYHYGGISGYYITRVIYVTEIRVFTEPFEDDPWGNPGPWWAGKVMQFKDPEDEQ